MTTVVSVLISSDFLKMETLVEEALDFLSQHLSDVVKLPIDLECLSAPLLSKIATRLTPEELDRVHIRGIRETNWLISCSRISWSSSLLRKIM